MISAAEIYDFKGAPVRKAWVLLCLTLIFLGKFSYGQSEPSYTWYDNEFLNTVGVGNPQDVVISIDTDSQGNIYILTLGDGIKKYDPANNSLAPYISGSIFNDPIDFAINSNDEMYVADLNDREVKFFNSSGTYISSENLSSGYYKPYGVAIDNSNNVYIAEYNDGSGAESTPSSRIHIFYTTGEEKEFQGPSNIHMDQPYRLDVDSNGFIYVAHAGNYPGVKVFGPDQVGPQGEWSDFQYQGALPYVKSPGSIVIDDQDYVHVIDYAERINFVDILKYDVDQSDLKNIRDGINNDEFKIKIFHSTVISNTFSFNYIKDYDSEMELPLDITFDSCASKMYVNDSDLNYNSFFWALSTLDFELEFYNRTPHLDSIDPIAQCIGDFEIELVEGSASITPEDINNASTDNCEIAAISLSQDTFTTAGDYNVVMTVTDNAGNQDSCTVQVTVTGEEEPTLDITCLGTKEIQLVDDQPVNVLAQELVSSNSSGLSFSPDSFQFDCSDIGTQNININATDDETGATDSCVVAITVKDVAKPVISVCPGDRDITLSEGETYKVPNFESETTYSDNCDSSLEFFQSITAGEEISESTPVTIRVTDDSGLFEECTFQITIERQQPPVAECNDFDVVLDENGNAQITAEEVYAGNGNLELSIDTASFNCSNIGANSVQLTVTDPDTDLSDSCIATITVLDTTPPEILECPPPRSETVNSEGAYEVPDYRNELVVTDNCTASSSLEISQNPGPGSLIYESQNVLFTITDEAGKVANCDFRLTLEETNQTPTAAPDTYSTPQNQTLNIGPPGVLVNDSDPDGDSLTATLVNNVTNGSLTLNPNGSFIYEPNTDFTGQDSFTYIVSDGEASSSEVTVNITVTAILSLSCPGDYPVFADENCQYYVPNFSEIVEVSPEGASISQSIEAGTTTITNADPFITITATYDGQSESCEIYLLLKDEEAPEVTCPPGETITLAAGESFSLPDYRDQLNITDNCDDEFQVVQDPAPTTQITEDTQVLFTVTDEAGNTANCSFDLNVTTEGSLAISCLADKTENLNENCSFTVPDYTTEAQISNAENAEIIQTPEAGTQVTGDGFEVALRVERNGEFDECSFFVFLEDTVAPIARCVAEYQVSLSEGETVIIDPEQIDSGSTDNCGDIELSLSKTEFTSADEGENRVTLRVTDAAGNTSTCEALVKVSLSTGSVNDPPVAYDEEYTTEVNTILNVSAANGVLVNDTDPENDELSAILDTDTEFGSLQLNPDGSFNYTPDTGFVGQDFFTYFANDGEFNSNVIFVSINVVDNSADFGCNSQAMLSLGPEGQASLDLELLYHGNTEGLEITVDQLVFTCNDIGENTVRLTYTGRLEGSCEVPVTVVDNDPPVLQLRDISIDLDPQGNARISYEMIDNGSFDQCGVGYTLSKTLFTCKNLGDNVIQVTAVDNSGNTATANVRVQVFAEAGICSEVPAGSEYIFIYPNPNTGSFKIATPADITIQRIEVFDKRGRFITARNYDSTLTEYSMETGPLQEAVYVLKLQTNDGVYIKRMIFKN